MKTKRIASRLLRHGLSSQSRSQFSNQNFRSSSLLSELEWEWDSGKQPTWIFSSRNNPSDKEKKNCYMTSMYHGSSTTSTSCKGTSLRDQFRFRLSASAFSVVNQSVRYSSSGQADNLQTGLMDVADQMNDVVATNAGMISEMGTTAGSMMTDVVAANAGIVSQVAATAGSNPYPWTLPLQYILEGVHVFTGLPWWLSIAVTTVLIRTLTLPVIIYQTKGLSRLSLLKPELEKVSEKIKASGYDQKVSEDARIEMKALFKKHKVTPFTPLLGGLVQAPIFIAFFFGVRTMAEGLPSFKDGGCLWFTDLATPDEFFVLPVLTSLSFLLTVELNLADGMQGQPNVQMMKNFMRGMAIVMIPLTATFPKALFCYWITSNLFSLVQGLVLKQKAVKDLFGIPEIGHLDVQSSIQSSKTPTTFVNRPKRLP